MKRNKQTKKQMTDQEWATAAAWLSGEGGSGEEAAHILISEEGDIMKKWNDLKQADKEDIA